MYDWLDARFDQTFTSNPTSVVLIQLFLILGWSRAVVEKVVDPSWWSGDVIAGFVADHDGHTAGWISSALHAAVVPYANVWALIVLALQLVIVGGLVSRHGRTLALGCALLLNTTFVLAGATNPSAFYLVLEVVLLLWLLEYTYTAERSVPLLRAFSIIASGAFLACLPMIATLDPAKVIDDPGAVICTVSFCTVIASVVARRHVRRRVFWTQGQHPEATIDLRREPAHV